MRLLIRIAATALAVGLLYAGSAGAQAYPSKPVRVITPFTAGSAADVIARVLGEKISKAWEQQVVIDNRIGANGIIGTEAAAKAPADGYTLLIANLGILAVNPHLYSKLPYDPIRDFTPVLLTATIPAVLVAHPSLPVKSVRELIAFARTHPGQINYASGGKGSAQHLPMEMLKAAAGIDLVHVLYKGLTPAFNDLLGGQIPIMFVAASSVVPYVKTGRLRVLATGSPKRLAALPDVPTVAEAGVPGFDWDSWIGYLAPAGTPKDIINKLHADITRALALPDVREKMAALGFGLVAGTPGEFAGLIRDDIARFGKLVKDAGLRPD